MYTNDFMIYMGELDARFLVKRKPKLKRRSMGREECEWDVDEHPSSCRAITSEEEEGEVK